MISGSHQIVELACKDNVSEKEKLTGRVYTKADLLVDSRLRDVPLQGFEDHYGNVVDYILRCTYKIWEQKNLATIYTHYSEDSQVYTPLGYTDTVQSVVDATTQMLSAFPDRQLYSVNIIWDGDEQNGYLSSHLIRSTMTNLGDSVFGEATGKKVDILCVADCLCKENLIVKEWLVRDTGSLVKQLGFCVENIAHKMAVSDMKSKITPWFKQETIERTQNSKLILTLKSLPQNFTSQDVVEVMLHNIWRGRNLEMVDDYYSYNISIEGLGGQRLCGTLNLKEFLTEFQASISESDFRIEHIQSIDSDAGENEKFVHVRWTMCGKHATGNMFGYGTGVPLHIMGISHYRLVSHRIAEEWLVFDEVAIWKQIKAGQLASGTI